MTVHAAPVKALPKATIGLVSPRATTEAVPELSLVAVHYNQPELLSRMLVSLARETIGFEVIVVNVSPEVELALPARLPYPLRVIAADNHGYADAVNRGLRLARGEFVAACNVDLEFQKGVLSGCVDYVRRHPEVGVAGPDLVFPDGARQHSARRFYTWKVSAWARLPWRRRAQMPGFYRDHLMMDCDADSPREVDWLTGAMLIVRRSAMRNSSEVFDPRYWLYFEDVDLCMDMWKRGWKVVHLPQLKVIHRYSRASRKVASAAGLHHAASFAKFVLKHGGLPQRNR